MSVDLLKVREFTKKAEGKVLLNNGNHKLYTCPAGKTTIGYGYNIESNGLSDDLALILLNVELSASRDILSHNVSYWNYLSDVRKSVLIDMCYNMGWPTLSKFKKMFAALEDEDYQEAANQMKDSKWYKDVGQRADKLIQSMKSDTWTEY
jgi:lysozyme